MQAQSGRFDRALETCQLLNDTDDPNRDAKGAPSGYRRNAKSVALAFVAIAKANAGDFAGAEKIANKIFDHTDRAFAALSIVQCQAKAGQAKGALEMAGRVALPAYKVRALLAAADGLVKSDDRLAARDAIAQARNLNNQVMEMRDVIENQCILVGVLAEGGEFDSAQRMAALIGNPRTRSAAQARIALAFARRGDYLRMSSALAGIRDPFSAIDVLNQIAALQAEAGHLRAACQTASQIPIPPARSGAVRAIMKACASKVASSEVANVIAALRTADERACGYLGLAEGLLERGAQGASAPGVVAAAGE